MLIIERLLYEKLKLIESLYNLTREIGKIVERGDENTDVEEVAKKLEARGNFMEKIDAIDKRTAMLKADTLEETATIQKLNKDIKNLLLETLKEDSANEKHLKSELDDLTVKIRSVNQGMKGIGAYVNTYGEEQSTGFDVKK